jgi:hypothetical protein
MGVEGVGVGLIPQLCNAANLPKYLETGKVSNRRYSKRRMLLWPARDSNYLILKKCRCQL